MSCDVPSLDRVFLQLGPLPIYWYGVIIATGAFLGLYIAMKESDRVGLKKDLFVDLVVFAIPISILFARIYYVTFEWERYADGPWWKIFAVWEGGIAIHGALIGAVLTAVVFARVKKIPFWQLADVAAPSLILGQAIGRWGNFMNQEAHGGPIMDQSVIDMHYSLLPDFIMNQMCIGGTHYYPTFLYESLWNILVLILLLWLRRKNPISGTVFLTYLATYSVGRFFIEGMRTDSLYIVGNQASEIAKAIRSTYEGQSILEPEVTGKIMNRMRTKQETVLHEQLTEREKEILLLMTKGKTNQEVADELFIALKTVKVHVSNILGKLEVQDRTQAVIYAFQNKLVE